LKNRQVENYIDDNNSLCFNQGFTLQDLLDLLTGGKATGLIQDSSLSSALAYQV
jgi:hypothetical protein